MCGGEITEDYIFQSTLPPRGATSFPRRGRAFPPYFNPRSPRGERQYGIAGGYGRLCISIHAPPEGSDVWSTPGLRTMTRFQSTLPPRGATQQSAGVGEAKKFQSTLPPRGATKEIMQEGFIMAFQSTLPPRGATQAYTEPYECTDISIHAPPEGSDQVLLRPVCPEPDFNPRSPRGERLVGSELL